MRGGGQVKFLFFSFFWLLIKEYNQGNPLVFLYLT